MTLLEFFLKNKPLGYKIDVQVYYMQNDVVKHHTIFLPYEPVSRFVWCENITWYDLVYFVNYEIIEERWQSVGDTHLLSLSISNDENYKKLRKDYDSAKR